MKKNHDITANIAFGTVFILIGALVLLNELDIVSLSWAYLVPILLIAAGIVVIISSRLAPGTAD
jgi:hypothetical protein